MTIKASLCNLLLAVSIYNSLTLLSILVLEYNVIKILLVVFFFCIEIGILVFEFSSTHLKILLLNEYTKHT